MYLIFLLYALFGSVFTAGKIGLEHTEPFFLIGSRMLLASFVILAYLLVFDRKAISVPKSSYLKLFLLGAFNIYLTNGFEFWGMQHISSAKTCFIYSLSPFFAAILSFLVFGEKLGKKKSFGLIIGFLGFIPILWDSSGAGESSPDSFAFISLAEFSVMLAALTTVYGWILMRQLVLDNIPPLVCNLYSMFIGGAFSLAHSALFETWNPVPITGSISGYLESTLWMMIVSSLICYNLYGYLLKRYSVTLMSFAGFTTPFFVALFSWFMIGETLNLGFYLSAVIVLLGLTLFYQEELKKEGLHKNVSLNAH